LVNSSSTTTSVTWRMTIASDPTAISPAPKPNST